MKYVFLNEDFVYFVMPVALGGELYDLVDKRKRLDEQTIIYYAVQIIDAIGYLHNKNIIHRDLKLENILLDEYGFLKLINFWTI